MCPMKWWKNVLGKHFKVLALNVKAQILGKNCERQRSVFTHVCIQSTSGWCQGGEERTRRAAFQPPLTESFKWDNRVSAIVGSSGVSRTTVSALLFVSLSRGWPCGFCSSENKPRQSRQGWRLHYRFMTRLKFYLRVNWVFVGRAVESLAELSHSNNERLNKESGFW